MAGVLLLSFSAGAFGIYAYTLRRLGRQLPAFLAGSVLLMVLIGLAAGLSRH